MKVVLARETQLPEAPAVAVLFQAEQTLQSGVPSPRCGLLQAHARRALLVFAGAQSIRAVEPPPLL